MKFITKQSVSIIFVILKIVNKSRIYCIFMIEYIKIVKRGICKMKRSDIINRLKTDLNLPKVNLFIEEKEYSEDEYLKLRNDLIDYFKNYVENVSADFEGGLKTKDGCH